jgi:hypothetical protein
VISEHQTILNDLDKLGVIYQVKLELTERENWQQHFHHFSLNSHQNNPLLLTCTQNIVLTGLALSKNSRIKEIRIVGEQHLFKAKLNCLSYKFSQKFPSLEGSSHAKWKCKIDIINIIDCADTDLNIIVVLENYQDFDLGKIKFVPKKISDFSSSKIDVQLTEKINSIAQSRELMEKNMANGRNYLFAIGNARSGTTALGRLLNLSPEICLGIERYGKIDNISAMSFRKKTFFDINSKGYLIRPSLYESIRPKYDQAKYVGDKRPGFIKYWKNTLLNLPQAKIIYIFRNIYDVAYSYNCRVEQASQNENEYWQLTRDYSVAVTEWNKEMNEIQNLAKFYEVYFVKYEDFFIDKYKIASLFNYLQVNTDVQKVKEGIERIYQSALALQKKERVLSEKEKEYIDSSADFVAYEQILNLYHQQYFLTK